MRPLVIAFIAFVLTFGGAVAAMFIRSWLPPPHLSKETEGVVRLGIGLVATMTALLLGLMTQAARSAFETQDAAVRTSAANILTLDRHLARFGPETKPTRDLILRAVTERVEQIWSSRSGGRAAAASVSGAAVPVEEVENQILRLVPQNDAQRWFKGEALKLSEDVVKARWRILGSGAGLVPLPFLVAVIFWLTVTFASFGLYAPRNATVVAVLAVTAVSVAAAVFLILEFDEPFEGMIKVSSAPLKYALTQLGR
jgi:hypothetical protein